MTLLSVSPSRPSAAPGELAELAEINLSLSVEGSYFQLVDFLRRIADPSITPRGITWSALAATPSEYPTLAISLTGKMFALLPAPVAAEPATPPATEAPTDAPTEEEAA